MKRYFMAIMLVLLAGQAFGHGMSEAEKQIIIEGGNLRYIWIGATHMLSGYDHLAFVFGVVFFLTRFREIVKYITAFTLGHSITLIIATFNAVRINYFLIDAVIALSVCYIAVSNLDWFRKHLKINPPNMLAMIFGLGLIHGLGLSTRLQQLPLNQDELLLNIISFNIGIELGQVVALAVMLLVINALRKSQAFPAFSKLANHTLILAGIALFGVQIHGYLNEGASGGGGVVSVVQAANPMPQAADWQDTITVNIPAHGETEYKLMLAKGGAFDFNWRLDKGIVYFDFHGEPKGDTSGYFESFKTAMDAQSSGSLTAGFEGTHGWYWKNDNDFPVEITLNVKGDYQRLDSRGTRTN